MKERPQVNIRLERDVLDQIDQLAQAEHIDRSDMARRLIGSGLTTYRMDAALRDYKRGAASASRAAEIAGVSLYDMLDRIHAEGVPYELDPDVLRRLDERAHAGAVREASAGYGGPSGDAETGIGELRAQFKPEKVKWLFVGESSPAGGTHFYRANSNLFRATREAFASALGPDQVPGGQQFLGWFRDHGYWLVDLADRPVNRLSDADRLQEVQAGVDQLAKVIRDVDPERLIVIKASIAGAIRQAAGAAGFVGPITELPFPVRQWRAVYERDLAQVVADATDPITAAVR